MQESLLKQNKPLIQQIQLQFQLSINAPSHVVRQVQKLIMLYDQDRFINQFIGQKTEEDYQKYQIFDLNQPTFKLILSNITLIKKQTFDGAHLKYCLNLNHIEHIHFQKLITLNFNSCALDNLEPLSFIIFPNLKQLNLDYNFITKLASFKKTNLKSLQILKLGCNQFELNQLKHLSLSNTLKLSQIHLKYNFYDHTTYQQPVFMTLIKLQRNKQNSKLRLQNKQQKMKPSEQNIFYQLFEFIIQQLGFMQ